MKYSYRMLAFLARAVITLTHLAISFCFLAVTGVRTGDNYRPPYPGDALKKSFSEDDPMGRGEQALLPGSLIHIQHLGALRY